MTAVSTIVARSLRLIGILDANETPAASDMNVGIEALNAMLARVEADGIPIGWAPVSLPSEDMPSPPEADEPIAYMLAARLADEYRIQAGEIVLGTAQIGLGKLHADALKTDAARIDYNLPGDSFCGRLSGFLGG